MSKKVWMSLFVIMLAISVVLTGCGSKETPKQAMEEASTTAAAMTSADFNMKMTLNLEFPEAAVKADPSLNMAANLMKNMELTAKGVYQADPMQTEMTLEAHIKGDMQTTITVPMVMTADKIYIKVPKTPFLPLPDDVTSKYLVMDMNELNKNSDVKVDIKSLDMKKQQEFSQDAMKIFTANFDEKTYFVDVDKKDAGIPDTADAKQVVKFQITNETLEPALMAIIEKVAPQILDLVGSDKYKDMFQVDPAELEKAKKEVAATDTEQAKKDIAEIKKALNINEMNIITAINKDNYPTYQAINANLDIKDEKSGNFKVGTKITNEYTNINQKANFKIGIPAETLTMEEFNKKMQGSGLQ
ncbi:hypothetical protein [Paenibacillus lutrae]|uniref:Lipoprotein n=1 Tax=Paenibacillus lutrae TaxID=2078573 RepID=A0A7X3FG06_9BACL|nr:hypothetical protein [Paenibacillus lutrae]MVO98907.1 hypothetical protein [Paenibacillus lutrae]